MKLRDLWHSDASGKLYQYLRVKRKGVHDFQWDLNPVGPKGFTIYTMRYLYYSQSNRFSPWQQNYVHKTA